MTEKPSRSDIGSIRNVLPIYSLVLLGFILIPFFILIPHKTRIKIHGLQKRREEDKK